MTHVLDLVKYIGYIQSQNRKCITCTGVIVGVTQTPSEIKIKNKRIKKGVVRASKTPLKLL